MSDPNNKMKSNFVNNLQDADVAGVGLPEASNDPVYEAGLPPPSGLESLEKIEAAFKKLTDAPIDLPHLNDAVQGLTAALGALEEERPTVRALRAKIELLIETPAKHAAAGATVLSLSKRKGRYLVYALMREIGRAHASGFELDRQLLRLVATWSTRMLLDGVQPSGDAIAKVRVALLYPNDKSALSWTPRARSRAITAAQRGLDAALDQHANAAIPYGLVAQKIRVAVANGPIEKFNRAFRRRVENLIDFHTLDEVAGAGGYGTLCEDALKENGAELLEMAETGCMKSLVVCLEVVTHLPCEVVLMTPISIDGARPKNALAWLVIENGTYCQIIYKIKERGAMIPDGNVELYEETTDVVTLMLSPSIHSLLLKLSLELESVPECVGDLTGDAWHHPRSRVVGKGRYRVTSRRLQESVPCLLLQHGLHRWPVALATTSHYLVSVGRRSYGVCRSLEIDNVVRESQELLGWPVREDSSPQLLIGAPTTPKSSSVANGLNILSSRADAKSPLLNSYVAVVEILNTHAHWLSMLLALTLSLRRWTVYELKTKELLSGDLMHFVDKDVHLHKGPGVPVTSMLREALDGWFELCRQCESALKTMGGPAETKLANQIHSHIDGTQMYGGVFTIDQVGRTKHVGHRDWVNHLPGSLKLRPNFARHYWPLKLMDLGIDQTTIDLLMRHQIEGLHPNSSNSTRKISAVQSNLRSAMDKAIAELGLKVPKAFSGAKK